MSEAQEVSAHIRFVSGPKLLDEVTFTVKHEGDGPFDPSAAEHALYAGVRHFADGMMSHLEATRRKEEYEP